MIDSDDEEEDQPKKKRRKTPKKSDEDYGGEISEDDEEEQVEEGDDENQDDTKDDSDTKPKKKRASRAKGTKSTKRAAKSEGGRKKREPKAPKAKKPPKNLALFLPDEELLDKVRKIESDLFTSTSKEVFVAPGNAPIRSSLEVFRAVHNKDHDLLSRIIQDVQHVHDPFIQRSADNEYNALDVAIQNSDVKAAKIFFKELKEPLSNRVYMKSVQLETQGTGSYNKHTFGKKIRDLNQARGSKEGNNAFTVDNHTWYSRHYSEPDIEEVCRYPISNEMVDFLLLEANNAKATFGGIGFYRSVESGNLKTAGYIAKLLLSYDGFGLNQLHVDVRTFTFY
jgi:hypothetical protein